MSIKHMKTCSGPLLQKCQSNCNQVSLMPLRTAILQKISKDEMLQRARKTGTPPTLWAGMETGWGGEGGMQPQKKAVWRFLRTLNTDLLHGLASPLLVLDQ